MSLDVLKTTITIKSTVIRGAFFDNASVSQLKAEYNQHVALGVDFQGLRSIIENDQPWPMQSLITTLVKWVGKYLHDGYGLNIMSWALQLTCTTWLALVCYQRGDVIKLFTSFPVVL